MRRGLLIAAGIVAGLLLLVWAGACAALWLRQDDLLFAGTPLPPDTVLSAAPDIHESRVAVPGAMLSVLEMRLPDPQGVVFFLHGNAGNLAGWFINPAFYREANYDLVMMDYRGYGKSTGRIESEAQLHADVEAVWRAVAARYSGRKVVVYGRSLGSALAAQLAVELQPDLTVLVSPFVSIRALAREQFAWAPAFLVRFPLRTDLMLPRLASPVLLFHGDMDQVIPAASSVALQALAPRSRLVVVPGAGHNDIHEFESYRQPLRQALAGLR